MNATNVLTLSAPHAVTYAKSEHSAALNPVRVRFDAFQLDEANATLVRDGMVDTSARETDCASPKPVFATMEEVRYAHELRLQLRTRLLHAAARSAVTCSVGAD